MAFPAFFSSSAAHPLGVFGASLGHGEGALVAQEVGCVEEGDVGTFSKPPSAGGRRWTISIGTCAIVGVFPELAATERVFMPTIPQRITAGVRGAIVISAGFKEMGPAGAALERRILEEARRGRMRLIGPNCLGVMNPLRGLNATFAGRMALPGSVGFLGQSGALCTAILDWSLRERLGFSAFVSIGSMLDVGWGDLIDYLGDDPHTRSIIIDMESIGDARSFLSAAREVALTKPIIVIKAGRTDAAARAATSHTGSLAGSDEVLDAAFRRCGVLRVDTISEVFYLAEVLSKQPRPKGPRLAIVTNAGGPGALATDALIRAGGELAELSHETPTQSRPRCAARGVGHFQGVTVQPMVRRDGYELIGGSSNDPQFGPVLLFGTGGQLVEVFKDRALALPPLNTTLARRMMEQTKIYTALKGVRGRKAVDLAALEQLLVRFSRLVVEQPWIKEIDINRVTSRVVLSRHHIRQPRKAHELVERDRVQNE